MIHGICLNTRMRNFLFMYILSILLISSHSFAQQNTTVHIYNKLIKTYPYRDANPIPQNNIIYPYYRFDLFTNNSVLKSWKVIELENQYIRVLILPEIGGKIWTAIEKSTDKPFIYDNDVVKFRDVAMRGPWTSGGIEANYGIIGHTPNCATPVDYSIQYKKDGSVSCFIGVLDLLTRTSWQIEINLPKDKAYFTTSSFWYNASSDEQPYYTWMNAAISAKKDLQFIFPGNVYLGHEGQHHNWPINHQNGKHIDWYNENNFGGYKSYHVFGTLNNFFGAYWHDEDFGMGRYSTREDKPGKKLWIWGLSQQGMIWEKLLTDSSGQYTEVQSGRLFNQAEEKSSFTPFKHKGFAPHSTDAWTEYWFPVVKTKGMVMANNIGTLNVIKHHNGIEIYFSPLQKLNDSIVVKSDYKILVEKKLQLNVMQLYHQFIPLVNADTNFTISIGKNLLNYESNPKSLVLNRPLDLPINYDWNSADGLYTLGHENMVERNYAEAIKYINQSIQKDSNYTPALIDAAIIHYHNGDDINSLFFSKRALAINTYQPAANYYYGLANVRLDKIPDAKDGFQIAALDPGYRSAAFINLAKIYFKEAQFDKATYYAEQSLYTNYFNVDAYQLLTLIGRITNNLELQTSSLEKLLSFNSLNHIAAYEKYLLSKNTANQKQFLATITNEFPGQTFLEMAIWYWNIGRNKEAIELLEMSPINTEIQIWKAYLKQQPLPDYLKPDMIFPFRNETNFILKKLMLQSDSWKLKYYSALIERNNNHKDIALKLLKSCDDRPDYAPFYAVRASLYNSDDSLLILHDLLRAYELEPTQWRYANSLVEFYSLHQKLEEAILLAKKTYEYDTANYLMGISYIQTLMQNKEYSTALNLLQSINILPYEGSTVGRNLYRKALLMLAIQQMKLHQYEKALAFIQRSKLWPENLGAGKPYYNMLDESLENWLEYQNYLALQNKNSASLELQKIIDNSMQQLVIAEGYISPFRYYVTMLAFNAINNPTQKNHFEQQCIKKFPNSADIYRLINDDKLNERSTLSFLSKKDDNAELWKEWQRNVLQ